MRVLSIPAEHPYTQAIQPAGVEFLPDPDIDGNWWPHPALEASWWNVDPTGRPADLADEHLFSDPDPVPAFAELRATGEVARTVTTQLVDEITRDLYKPT